MLALHCDLLCNLSSLDRLALLVMYQGSLFMYSCDVALCILKPFELPCHEDQLMFLGMTGRFSVSSLEF